MKNIYKLWILLFLIIICMAVLALFVMKEPYTKNYKYQDIKYEVHLIFENDEFIIAGVRNDGNIKSKLIDYNYALENGLISETKNPFKRYKFNAEKVVKYILDE